MSFIGKFHCLEQILIVLLFVFNCFDFFVVVVNREKNVADVFGELPRKTSEEIGVPRKNQIIIPKSHANDISCCYAAIKKTNRW